MTSPLTTAQADEIRKRLEMIITAQSRDRVTQLRAEEHFDAYIDSLTAEEGNPRPFTAGDEALEDW